MRFLLPRASARAWLSCTAAVLHLVTSLCVLAFAFPHEDAFILFKFAKNVARGSGIVYFPGGPHAEGATDFLWMISLAAGQTIGIDVAIAAALINAAGAGACAWMLLRGSSARTRALDVAAIIALLASPAAAASCLGFGTMAFVAIALALYVTVVDGDPRTLPRVPFLCLALALFRPDGGILAIGLGAIAAWRARGARPFIVRTLVCAAIGAAYFFWRARYFGEWLPLPLYVKRHFGGAPGINDTLDWIVGTLVPLAALTTGGALLGGRRVAGLVARGACARHAIALIPVAVHVASFAPTVQTQNVANRFQAPATIILLYVAIQILRRVAPLVTEQRRLAQLGLALAALLPPSFHGARMVHEVLMGDYVDGFAPRLAELAPAGTHIATTEAGHIAFWTGANVLDLVGLNTRETARLPPTNALLSRFDPDIVMLHPAGAIDEAAARELRARDTRSVIPMASLRPYMVTRGLPLDRDLPPYRTMRHENVYVAPVVTMAFLESAPEKYELFLVRSRTRGGFHVYAFKRDWAGREPAIRALEESHVAARTSYFAVMRGV